MNEVKLRDITYRDENITEWDFVEPVKGLFRIYFKPQEKTGSGFKYYVVEWTSNIYGEENWGDSCCVGCLFNGVAYFDGLRHHYMGDEQTDNYGYIYYPNLTNHIKILESLRELEHRYCRDYES